MEAKVPEYPLLDDINWLNSSTRMLHHAGTWDFEYLEQRNRITRVYSHACTMAYLDETTFKIMIISAGATPTGALRLIDFSLVGNNMSNLLIDAEDIVFNITVHTPGLIEDDVTALQEIVITEIVVDDVASMHRNFAYWAMQYLQTDKINSEEELNFQLHLLLSSSEGSYIAGLASSTSDIEAILKGGKHPVANVQESKVHRMVF
jgi:hypothetical protein